MGQLRDLTGQRFGKLTAVKMLDKRDAWGSVIWECSCDCGQRVEIRSRSLTSGNAKSCGCLNKQVAAEKMAKRAKVDCVEGTRLSYLTKTVFAHNVSGVRGVSFQKASGKWKAEINFKGKCYYLGLYKEYNAAVSARKAAERELWYPFLEDHIGSFRNDNERKEKLNKYIKDKIDSDMRRNR